MVLKKVGLIVFLSFPLVVGAGVSIPRDTRFLYLVRPCKGLMKELRATAKGFNTLARVKQVSSVTLQGDFNQIIVSVRLILEKGRKGKCDRAFDSVEYWRLKIFDYYDYNG